MNAQESKVRKVFEMLGFNEEQTVGGCTAWLMTASNKREVLVTDGDCSAVLDMDSACKMYLMDGVSSDPVNEMSFSSVGELVLWFDKECAFGKYSTSQVIDRLFI